MPPPMGIGSLLKCSLMEDKEVRRGTLDRDHACGSNILFVHRMEQLDGWLEEISRLQISLFRLGDGQICLFVQVGS